MTPPHAPSPVRPDRPSPASPLLLAGLLALAAAVVLWLRIEPGWRVYSPAATGGAVVLPETDPYYHYRQAAYTVEHYPALMRQDGGSHYPAVERNDAAGLFTLFLATVTKLAAWATGLPPAQVLHWVCVLAPPAAAAALVPALFLLVRRLAPVPVALVMVVWFILLPGDGLARTLIGACDHHVAEMLLSLLGVLGLVRLAAAPPPGRAWAGAFLSALPLGLLYFTWLGAPLYLPVFSAAIAGQLFADTLAGRPALPLAAAAARYWTCFFALVAGAGLAWPDLVMHVPLWKATLAGVPAVAAGLLAAAAFLDRAARPRAPLARCLAVAAAGAGLGAVVLALSPFAREALLAMVSRKSLLVLEHVPVTTTHYLRVTGVAGVIALLVPMMGVLTGRAAARPGWWLAVLPSLLLVALWCRTFDYAYLGALHAVVLSGYFFASDGAPAERWRGRACLAAATGLVLAGALLGLTYPPRAPAAWFEDRSTLATPGWLEATAWLARIPPAEKKAGVLTDWPHGNLVNALTPHPAVASRYPEAEGLRPLFLETEEAVRAAPLRGSTVAEAVRYVVLEPSCIAEHLPAYLTEVGLSPAAFTGTRAVRSTAGGQTRPAMNAHYARLFASRLLLDNGDGLAHFRLVFAGGDPVFYRLVHDPAKGLFGPETTRLATPALREQAEAALRQGVWREGDSQAYEGRLLPGVMIFEQVAGARLAGHATPGSEVTATLRLTIAGGETGGRTFLHRVATRAGEDGAFELVVPYATEAPGDAVVRPDAAWTLSCENRRQTCAVGEAAVQNGDRITVPPFPL